MANLSEDIQCADSDTRPPMLDRNHFASWQQRIHLYCQGKENGVNIQKSIDEGPFQMGIFQETLVKGNEGALHLEQRRNYSRLLCLGRFVTAVKLNRGLRDSNYDQLYAYLKQHEAHANENKMMLDRFTQHTVDPLALMSKGRQNRGQGNNARGTGAAGYGGAQNRVGNANPGGQDNVVDEDVDEQPVQDLALNVDNVFQADDCDAFDSDVDEAPTAQTMFMVSLSSADPVYNEVSASYEFGTFLSEGYQIMTTVRMLNVSSVPNDAYMMILNDMHEQSAKCVSVTTQINVVDKSLNAELATYKEQVELYERQAKFELTERE
ncbi:hypothetical protein Tco_1273638 [Tanacetum coccineum]